MCMVFVLIIILLISGIFAIFSAQKMKVSIKDFFGKCEQIRSFLRICSYLIKKSLMENVIFCEVIYIYLMKKGDRI